jgi:hypothetical protein
MYGRSKGSPAFLVPHRREGIGELVSAIRRMHARPVAWAAGKGRAPGRRKALQDRCWRAFPDWDDARDEPPVLSDVDCLAMAHPRQHLTRVVAQVPQTHRMRFGSHADSVLQNCGHKLNRRRLAPPGSGDVAFEEDGLAGAGKARFRRGRQDADSAGLDQAAADLVGSGRDGVFSQSRASSAAYRGPTELAWPGWVGRWACMSELAGWAADEAAA